MSRRFAGSLHNSCRRDADDLPRACQPSADDLPMICLQFADFSLDELTHDSPTMNFRFTQACANHCIVCAHKAQKLCRKFADTPPTLCQRFADAAKNLPLTCRRCAWPGAQFWPLPTRSTAPPWRRPASYSVEPGKSGLSTSRRAPAYLGDRRRWEARSRRCYARRCFSSRATCRWSTYS